jgi:para-nitrobenzyl esterase
MDHHTSPSSPVRTVEGGDVAGTLSDGVLRFLGVPYAAPPVGANRFKKPQPVEPWNGERDATKAGPTSWYKSPVFPGLDIEPLIGPGGTGGDDYLTLNIWAPEGAKDRPVLVWIHGGAFVLGSKDASVSDGAAFAKSGVVCVAMNYRLGIDGFLPIPGVPTNLGLLDQIAALRWVQENVATFGGDADNVTVFGESAGAMAIADLVTSPLAKDLFKRAIIQSGHGAMVRDIGTMQRLVRKLAKLLRVSPNVDGFRTVDFEAGWAAMERVGKPFVRLDLRDPDGHEPVFGISRFTPVFGDDVLPKKPLDALKEGAGADVDVLIGTNAEEMNFYFVPTKVRQKIPGWLAKWLLKKSHPTPRQTLKAYGHGEKGRPAGHAYTDAMTDLVFRWPARRFAEEHQGRTHVYEFDWRSPRYDGHFGSTHGMELPFVFKTLPVVSGSEGLVGENPPQGLADEIHQIWVDFATDGTLPWPEFRREQRNVRLLGSNKTIDEAPMPAAPYLP